MRWRGTTTLASGSSRAARLPSWPSCARRRATRSPQKNSRAPSSLPRGGSSHSRSGLTATGSATARPRSSACSGSMSDTISEHQLEDKVRLGVRKRSFSQTPGKVLAELRALVEDSVHLHDHPSGSRRRTRWARLSDTAPVQPRTCGRRRAGSNGSVSGRRTATTHSANPRSKEGGGNAAVPAGGDCDRQRRDRQGRLREDGLRRRDHGGPARTRSAGAGVPPRPHPVPVGIDHRGSR